MKIDHVAIYVTDLEGARDFFMKYFGAVSNGGYHNHKTDFRSFFLRFRDGSRLELMTRPELAAGGREGFHCGYDHLAFSVGSREAVDSLTERFRQDGYPVLSGPRVTGDGYYESCIAGFEGNVLEITV